MSMSEGTETQAKVMSPIPAQHQSLCNGISDLDENIKRLLDRIRPVLGPDFPRPSETDKKSPEETSELANAISYEASRVREINEVVCNIINRIEL